eukprot:COSAG06_NODE_209_length_20178_cov_4.309478_16_plen_68_part_00
MFAGAGISLSSRMRRLFARQHGRGGVELLSTVSCLNEAKHTSLCQLVPRIRSQVCFYCILCIRFLLV